MLRANVHAYVLFLFSKLRGLKVKLIYFVIFQSICWINFMHDVMITIQRQDTYCHNKSSRVSIHQVYKAKYIKCTVSFVSICSIMWNLTWIRYTLYPSWHEVSLCAEYNNTHEEEATTHATNLKSGKQ